MQNRPEHTQPRDFLDFVYDHLTLLQILISGLQILVFIINLLVFSGSRHPYWVMLAEGLSPYLLVPLFRFIRRRTYPGPAPPDLRLFGKYMTILAFSILAAILILQGVNWQYRGEEHGGVFYFGSLFMAALWGFRPPRNPATGSENTT